ncbi:BolA family protein [Mannheimia massilioguelmaensis]|uniref:BolA family protein n=1 Tax=Mannheimia massilioguelmaensis TaxID=1604354 RepID=UPI0005C99A0A|nr:BolA family protein [Mannheimia massilioguelmaensis]
MNKQQELTQRLTQAFCPQFLQVENESHMHSSNLGGESHFKIVIVSEKFEGKSRIARHRMVYQYLSEELATNLHALALHTYTLIEWEQRGKHLPKSTNCLGVNK